MSKRTFIGAGLATVVAAIIWTITLPAGAQMGMRGGDGPGMMYGPRMMGPGYGSGMTFGPGMMMGGCPMIGTTTDGQTSTFTEGRIAFLRAELGITDAQKAVWDAYAEAIKGNLQSMQGMWQTMKGLSEAKTPVERLDVHIVAMETRLTVLKGVKPALANLYAALTAEQKKKADELLTGMGCMM